MVNTRSAHARHPGVQTQHPGAALRACAVRCRSHCACATSGHSVIHSAAALLSVRSIRALPHLHPGLEDAMWRYDPHCACAVFGYSSKPPHSPTQNPIYFPYLFGFTYLFGSELIYSVLMRCLHCACATSGHRKRHFRVFLTPPHPPLNRPHVKNPFRTSFVP